jgi:hypothetical protein
VAVIGIICLIIFVMFAILWLYSKTSTGNKYIKTTGEIVDVRNMAPLVDKRQVNIGKRYIYTECKYHGDVYVTVRFIRREGEELTRRYTSSEPVYMRINEHKRIVPQYRAVFPEWQTGRKIKVYYDPANTLDIFVGRVL